MPRTGGVYSEPAGTKAVSGQTIQSVPYNTFVDDLVTDANAARPVTAGGTGATTVTEARTNLGVANFVDKDAVQTLTNKSLQDATTFIVDETDGTKKVQFQVSGVATGATRTWTFPNTSDTFVGTTATQTLTNKNLDDNTTVFVEAADNTKKMIFELQPITPGNTRVLSVPDATTTLVGTNVAQTLTNKTISGGSFSGTISGSFTFGGTVTLTRPVITLQDSTTTFQDEGDNTRQFQIQLSGLTPGATRVWNVPDSNDAFVGVNTPATLTNKTLTSPTINAAALIGTFSGTPAYSGRQKISASDASTATTYLSLFPTDRGVGKPNLDWIKTATPGKWQLQIDDGAGNAGSIIDIHSPTLTWNDASLVDVVSGQVLRNKSLEDISTVFFDNGDNTKQMIFELQGITTSTKRVLTVPDANTTIVGTDVAQTLTNKTHSGGSITGTIAGTPTYTGLQIFSLNTATTATDYLELKPTDWATGKPMLAFNKASTANLWNIGLWDGTNASGTINFNASTGLNWNGNQIADVSTSQTLSNKTLASPAMTGTPTAPTPTGTDNSTAVATTAFVQGVVGPSSYMKISSAAASGSSVVFSSIPSSGYEKFILIAKNVASNAVATQDGCSIYCSTDSGSTFHNTSGDYRSSAGASRNSLITFSICGANSTFQHSSSEIDLFGLGDSNMATYANLAADGAWSSTTSGPSVSVSVTDSGRAAAEADNAIKLQPLSGATFTAGTFTLYGVKS